MDDIMHVEPRSRSLTGEIYNTATMHLLHINEEQLAYVIRIVDDEYGFYFRSTESGKGSLRSYFYEASEGGRVVLKLDHAAFESLPGRIKTRIQDLIFRVSEKDTDG